MGKNGQEKSMQKSWVYWYKFQLNFIPLFYLSLLESLVLCAEFPALEAPR